MNFEILDLAVWAAGAVIIGGIIEWAKNFLPKVSPKTWAAIMPIIAVGVAVSKYYATPEVIWWNAFGFWAFSQLFYQVIIQRIRSQIDINNQGSGK